MSIKDETQRMRDFGYGDRFRSKRPGKWLKTGRYCGLRQDAYQRFWERVGYRRRSPGCAVVTVLVPYRE